MFKIAKNRGCFKGKIKLKIILQNTGNRHSEELIFLKFVYPNKVNSPAIRQFPPFSIFASRDDN